MFYLVWKLYVCYLGIGREYARIAGLPLSKIPVEATFKTDHARTRLARSGSVRDCVEGLADD